MEVKEYERGHIVMKKCRTISIVSDKIALYFIREQAPCPPIAKDLIEYIKTGKKSEKLEKITSQTKGMIVIYRTKNEAIAYDVKIPPRKVKTLGREFYLLQPLKGTYILPNTDHEVYYDPSNKEIIIGRLPAPVTIKLPVDTTAEHVRRIIEHIDDRKKLKETILQMFPAALYSLEINIVKNKVIAQEIGRPLKMVASTGPIKVYISGTKKYTYPYGCAPQISRHGLDPSKVPCLKPV